MRGMKATAWIGALVFFFQLPIPLYWLIFHPAVGFWRRHGKAVYIAALLLSWGPVTAFLLLFRAQLFRFGWPRAWETALGLALISFEVRIFHRVKRDLGVARMAGEAELRGDIAMVGGGIYSRLRNPRYVGAFLAIVGACLLAGTPLAWAAAALWTALTLLAISLEERELRARLGPPYEEYCRRVPRFIPLRPSPKNESISEFQPSDSL
jgi:protein-S-isoprenylcysteine O-methyltransferase Ste14